MQVFSDVIPRIFEIINSDLSLFDIIRRFFEMHIEFLKQDPSTPMFVLRDINRVPHLLERILKERNVDIYAAVNAKIADAVERGDIKFIRGEELILNMVSLSIFQFAGAPIFKTIGRISDEDFDKLIEERKKTLAEFVISAIKR